MTTEPKVNRSEPMIVEKSARRDDSRQSKADPENARQFESLLQQRSETAKGTEPFGPRLPQQSMLSAPMADLRTPMEIREGDVFERSSRPTDRRTQDRPSSTSRDMLERRAERLDADRRAEFGRHKPGRADNRADKPHRRSR